MTRIAMVSFSCYPNDPRVRREAEALAEIGMSVEVICINRNGQSKEEKINNVKVYRIDIKRKRGTKFRYLFEYGYFMFLAFFKLSWLHLWRRYKIIHIHNLPDIMVICGLIPKLTGAKIILDMHEIMPEFFMRKYKREENDTSVKLIKNFEKISTKIADHILVKSHT